MVTVDIFSLLILTVFCPRSCLSFKKLERLFVLYCKIIMVMEIVIVIFSSPTGCVWCGQEEWADSDWALGRPDSGRHKKEHWVWFCCKCFCELIQPFVLHHRLRQCVFTGREPLICDHFGSWPLQCTTVEGRMPVDESRGGGRWGGVVAGALLWLMGQGLAQESEAGEGGASRSWWKQGWLELWATCCKVPRGPLFFEYLSAVLKLD